MKLSGNYIFLLLFIFGVLPISYTYFNATQNQYATILSFEDCVKAGIAVTPTYPETCKIPGKIFTNQKQIVTTSTHNDIVDNSSTSTHVDADPKNAAYYVEGELVHLTDGFGVLPVNISINRPTTTIRTLNGFASFDVNQDSVPDKLFLLAAQSGEQKKYQYYLASLVSLFNGYTGSNAIYLGVDIASTTIDFKNNELMVVYFVNEGSIPQQKKKRFNFKNERIEEIIQ